MLLLGGGVDVFRGAAGARFVGWGCHCSSKNAILTNLLFIYGLLNATTTAAEAMQSLLT